MHRSACFSKNLERSFRNALSHILTSTEEDFFGLVRDIRNWQRTHTLFVGDDLAGQTGKLRFVGFNSVECFRQFEVFSYRCNLVVVAPALLLKFLVSGFVRTDPLFETDENIC